MSDRLVWSSRMTQDYLKGLSAEEKHNLLLDRGYDAETLNGRDLDDVIDTDEYMWEDDADDFYNKVAPIINSQTLNGKFILVNKNDPNADFAVLTVDDLQDTNNFLPDRHVDIYIYDDKDGLVVRYEGENNSLEFLLYAIPENEPEQVKFVQEIMPTFKEDALDLMVDDEEDKNPLDDYASALLDEDVLYDFVDQDALRKFGTRIKYNELGESLEESIEFPKEVFVEAKSNGIGYENANKFMKYLRDNDVTDTGPFGEFQIVNKGGSVRLFSQVSDLTFTFTDDDGVVVEGTDEEFGNLEEYFDSLDDFVDWCQATCLSLGSDVGSTEMGKYLYSGKDESLVEEVIEEKKSKNPEKLAEEVEELKEDFYDFGPDNFYDMTFAEFEKQYPIFTRDVIRDFLTSYVEISNEEMNDPEVIDAWQEGTLIWPEDWKLLFVHADKQIAGKSPQWKDDVVVESLNEGENMSKLKAYYGPKFEEKEESLKEEFKTWTDVYKLFNDCADKFFPNEEKIAEEVKKIYEQHKGDPAVEEAWRRWNDKSSFDEVKEDCNEELAHNPNGDEMGGQIHSILNDLADLQNWAEESNAPETLEATREAEELLDSKEDILKEEVMNETEDYLVVPGDLNVAKELETESLKSA